VWRQNHKKGPPDNTVIICLSIYPRRWSGVFRGGFQAFPAPYPIKLRGSSWLWYDHVRFSKSEFFSYGLTPFSVSSTKPIQYFSNCFLILMSNPCFIMKREVASSLPPANGACIYQPPGCAKFSNLKTFPSIISQ